MSAILDDDPIVVWGSPGQIRLRKVSSLTSRIGTTPAGPSCSRPGRAGAMRLPSSPRRRSGLLPRPDQLSDTLRAQPSEDDPCPEDLLPHAAATQGADELDAVDLDVGLAGTDFEPATRRAT